MVYVELVLMNGDIEYAEAPYNFEEMKLHKIENGTPVGALVVKTIDGYLVPYNNVVKYKVHKEKPWVEKKVGGKLNKSNDDITWEPLIKFDKDMKESLSKIFEELKRELQKDKKPYI